MQRLCRPRSDSVVGQARCTPSMAQAQGSGSSDCHAVGCQLACWMRCSNTCRHAGAGICSTPGDLISPASSAC